MARKYDTPQVRDYGTIVELTAMASSINGLTEDAINKAVPFHHHPPASVPSG